jgi:signal transduction histidine kinase
MKEFAHPGSKEKSAADLNKALENALIVSRNELKYVADVKTDFGALPPVVCNVADINQVFLNLFINAAHAIAEVVRDTRQKGTITVRTRQEGGNAVISISDTGCGILENIRAKVFDPFFTTKPVGRGSGQGLAIARATIVEQHGGTIGFEPNDPQGTTFRIALPLEGASAEKTE